MNVTPFRTGYGHSWAGTALSRTLLAFYGR